MELSYFFDKKNDELRIFYLAKDSDKSWTYKLEKGSTEIERGTGNNDFLLRDMYPYLEDFFPNEFAKSHHRFDWFLPPYPIVALRQMFKYWAITNDYAVTHYSFEENKLFEQCVYFLWKDES